MTFDTKEQLHTLPLGQEELLGGTLNEASKQAEERAINNKVSNKVPQSQVTSSSAPSKPQAST